MRRNLLAVVVVICGVALIAAGCTRQTAPPPVKGPLGPMPGPGSMPGMMKFSYVCPTHADQKSDQPGKCPTCQAFLKADTDQPVEYFCPMHPGAVKTEPGECDQCRPPMALQARATGAGAPPGVVEPKTGAPEESTDTPVEEAPEADAPTKTM
jgi:hypothetical protein